MKFESSLHPLQNAGTTTSLMSAVPLLHGLKHNSRQRGWPEEPGERRDFCASSSPDTLMSMQISTTLSDRQVGDARLAEILANPGFGNHFTDHMLTVEWTPERGWYDA